MAHGPEEIKTNMTKTTKIAIAAAIVAAVVFPGVAALAAGTDPIPVKRIEQRKIEEQKKFEQKRLELKQREDTDKENTDKESMDKQELKDKQSAQRAMFQKRAEELKSCRQNNRKAQADFLKTNKEAQEVARKAMRQLELEMKAKIKNAEDKDAREEIRAEKNTEKKLIQGALQKASKTAMEARKNNSKKCVPNSTNTTPVTTTTNTPE